MTDNPTRNLAISALDANTSVDDLLSPTGTYSQTKLALTMARDYLMWLVEIQKIKRGAVQPVREQVAKAISEVAKAQAVLENLLAENATLRHREAMAFQTGYNDGRAAASTEADALARALMRVHKSAANCAFVHDSDIEAALQIAERRVSGL